MRHNLFKLTHYRLEQFFFSNFPIKIYETTDFGPLITFPKIFQKKFTEKPEKSQEKIQKISTGKLE